MKVNTKDVRSIVNATFPDYRRRSVYVEARETVTLHDLNWSGGTRSEYRSCSVDGRPLENKVDLSGPAPWENPYEGKTITIPPGLVVVRGGHFCGKVSTLYIYVSPENMPKLITA